MATKIQPIGVCDHCLGPIPPGKWYTRRGPRLYCSVDCRNTANSRNGSQARSIKAKARVRLGEWLNPAILNPPSPEEQARRARIGRLREVAAGKWRNPGLTPEARKVNSLPRKHSGPLAEAIERLGRGERMENLTPGQAEAYRAYRKKLRRPGA